MKPGDESVRRAGEGRTPLTGITLSIINYLSLATCFLSYYYYYYYLVFPGAAHVLRGMFPTELKDDSLPSAHQYPRPCVGKTNQQRAPLD